MRHSHGTGILYLIQINKRMTQSHGLELCERSPLDDRILTLVGMAGISRSNDLRSQGIHPQQRINVKFFAEKT
jgi:hypothetical protein